jgi:hypothetical protein
LNHVEHRFDRDTVPPRNKTRLILAGVVLMVPVVALLSVGTFAKREPTVAGFPFFIWYQFLWVFLCSASTWTAYHLVQISRPRRRETRETAKTSTGKERRR